MKKYLKNAIIIGAILCLSLLPVEAGELFIQDNVVINVGESKQIEVTNKTNIKWLSGNKSVATVTFNGIVHGIKEGKVYIIARDMDTLQEYKCLVTVQKESNTDNESNENNTPGVDDTTQSGSDNNGTGNNGDQSESDKDQTGNNNSSTEDDSTQSGEDSSDQITKPVEFKIQNELVVAAGKSKQVRIEGEKTNIKWLSGNNRIATVNSSGIVQGIKEGKVWIIARDMDTLQEYRCFVIVIKQKPEEYFDFSKGISDKMIIADGWSSGDGFESFWKKENVKLEANKLLLEITKNELNEEKPWLSGEIFVNDFYQYGMYEVSMKPIKASGVITGFFTYTGPGYGSPWDEIDIEFLGKDTSQVQFNYVVNGNASHKYIYSLGFDASEEFHTYGFRWESDYIAWYIDGKEVYRATGKMPSSPSKIMANVWVTSLSSWAGNFDGKIPKPAEIEWIKFKPMD